MPSDQSPSGSEGHRSTASRVLLAWPLVICVVVMAALPGCAGPQFGSELSTKPKPRLLDKPDGTTLRVPQEQPLNIVLPRASKEPGLTGTAEADAGAKPSGEAFATAAVTGGGSAEGAFQLGHAVANATDQQVDCDFSLRLGYEFDARASTELTTPDAVVSLRLYARTDHGRLLRDLALVSYSTANGGSRQQSTESVQFTLTLAPGEAVSVFLAGQAKVSVADGRSGAANLKLHDLQLEVVTRPAPAVRTIGGPSEPERQRGAPGDERASGE